MTENENKPKFIWEGAVGAKINSRTNGKTGEEFYSFELVRYYTENGSDEAKYSSSFTERNAQALGRVIGKTLDFIEASKAGNPESTEEAAESANPSGHIVGKIEPVKIPADQALS